MKQQKPQNKLMNKGITLIALVVTIVVLLILASVSIATLTGENGIIAQAQKASKETNLAQVKEILKMAVSNIETKYNQNTIINKKSFYENQESFCEASYLDTSKYNIEYYQLSGDTVKIKLKKNDIYSFLIDINNGIVEEFEEVSCEIGDYVDYPINYTNYIPENQKYGTQEQLQGWRVIDIDENGKPTKLVSAGSPLTTSTLSSHADVYSNLVTNFNSNLGIPYIDTNYTSSARSITLEDVSRILGINYFEVDDWLLKDLSNNSPDFADYASKKSNLLELSCNYFIASDFTHSSSPTSGMYYYYSSGKQIYYAGNWQVSGVRVVIDLKPNIQVFKTNSHTGTNSNSPYILTY